MLLTLNLGNTHLQIGLFEGNDLRMQASLRTDAPRSDDEYALLIRQMCEWKGVRWEAPEGVILASVVPSLTPTLQNAARKLTDAPMLTVGPGIKTGFPIRLDNPSELGADLAANAAGVLEQYGSPAVIVDAGCATTVSVIDRTGAYAGCCILPGVQMSLDALHGAELLPELAASDAPDVIGKNTADSMRVGVLRGTALSIDGFFELYKSSLGLDDATPLVITGAYAERLLPYLQKTPTHIPNLTLKGLCAIYRHNKRKF